MMDFLGSLIVLPVMIVCLSPLAWLLSVLHEYGPRLVRLPRVVRRWGSASWQVSVMRRSEILLSPDAIMLRRVAAESFGYKPYPFSWLSRA